MKKLLTSLKTHLLKYFKVGGQFKKRKSEDFEIYLRHMKNTTGTPKERWERVCNTIIDPMVVLP